MSHMPFQKQPRRSLQDISQAILATKLRPDRTFEEELKAMVGLGKEPATSFLEDGDTVPSQIWYSSERYQQVLDTLSHMRDGNLPGGAQRVALEGALHLCELQAQWINEAKRHGVPPPQGGWETQVQILRINLPALFRELATELHIHLDEGPFLRK